MRQLTVQQVRDDCGGVLPADATLRSDDGPERRPPSVPPAPRKGNSAGRFADLNAFADYALGGLTGAEVKVWLILFRDTKAATGVARTGQADIARRAGIDARTVRRALDTLGAKGMVTTVRRGKLNAGPSAYRVRPTGAA